MNNNRNNRRRGRGNRNQGGNGAQLNRIDSRARGNAPQMLDKYKKLAQDAQHNGDRVQMEYYLQFADHYFRVIADNKARQDEQRAGGRRPDERGEVEDFEDDFDFGRRSDTPARSVYEQQDSAPAGDVVEGEPGQEGESFLAEDRGNDDRGGDRQRGQRRQRKERDGNRDGGNRDGNRAERDGNRAERAGRDGGERAEKRAERPERAERSERLEKPARTRKPRKSADDGEQRGIDSSILPPSIRGDDAGSGETGGALETVE
ncbi:DUF4167 domain-containing protein [Erythrobacter sp. NE805]|uniref:DUF4167 domain-containing protein n=1 Tax=Erythrobacter sp. NE805 TaxID=3389875 RepID=UPI00396B10F1